MDGYFLTREFSHLRVEKTRLDKNWGTFSKKIYKKKQDCSICCNAFREENCFEFFVYKCLCKCCEREEIMCRCCAYTNQHFVHLCKCKKNERHITSSIRDECFDI